MKRNAIVAAILLLLIGLMAMRPWLTAPSAAETARAGGFDERRALARLERVLGPERPHPVDSAEADAVRARLVAELSSIGLRPEVTDDFICSEPGESRTAACARVRNVIASVGPREGRHVLLVSHYDSVRSGPGAADDGIGVAAMMEAAAVLKNRRLARPVTFLFNEGEEWGLLGARAFLERNPLAERVDSLVNLEARGVEGPAIMFETSRPNGRALGHYARAAQRPAANSLTTDFYALIPNSTDVSVFAERPWTILNFAVIGNETRYHSPGDRLDALDPRSLAHMGAQALAVAEDMANGEAPGSGERIYADMLGTRLVTLPATLGILLLGLLLAAALAIAWRRRGGVVRGIGIILLALADAALTVFVLQWLVGLAFPGEFWRAHPEAIALAVDVTALTSAVAALLWLARPLPRDRLRIAYWLLFLALGALLTLAAPGAAIFFLLPPALFLIGLAGSRRFPAAERAWALLAWAALFLTWAPLLHLSQILLDFDAAWTFAPAAALILLPVAIELKPALAAAGPARTTAALALASAGAWAATFLLFPAYSEDRKQAFGIEYVLEGDRARWMVVGDHGPLPEAFDGFERTRVDWSTRKRSAAPAPRLPVLTGLAAGKVAERPAPGGRVVTLRLASGGAETIVLRAEPEAGLRAVRADGRWRRFGGGGKDEDFTIRCQGRSCDGLSLDILIAGAGPVDAVLMGMANGLPAAARPLLAARPADAAPQYSPDGTVVVRPIRL